MSPSDQKSHEDADFDAIEYYDSEIESVLTTPIFSEEEAEQFLLRWMYDGFGYPLDHGMFELRTVLEPDQFEELQNRVRELYSLAGSYELDGRDEEEAAEEAIGELFAKVEWQWQENQRAYDEFDIDAYNVEFPIHTPDPDVRSTLGSIGSEEDPPYSYTAEEGAPYEDCGATVDQDVSVSTANRQSDIE